ncbi:MAG: glycine cleavage system aminomethyltransferase GcvT [Deltaproteobacteria bacterium]|nr:glycine cleavage system aminomethyltransferase GcvT [Deltaproteobacteria bacterium]
MKKLLLHEEHQRLGAVFGDFAGYEMPLYYSRPLEEHHSVRRQAGVFDISHMGQLRVEGPQAREMLDYAMPNNVAAMADGDALYTPMLREDGGILDDLIVYRHSENRFQLIVNGATKQKDREWLDDIAMKFDAEILNLEEERSLFAVQGPKTFGILEPYTEHPPGKMGYFTFRETRLFGIPVFLARTGYTGEPGCEIAVRTQSARELWNRLVGDLGITPIGLAARDSLRMEASLPLYGHEMSEERHPFESGLGWTIKMKVKGDFIGRKALEAIKASHYLYSQAGLEISGRGIAREGYTVFLEGKKVGQITSGVLSPTLGKAIALARIRTKAAQLGNRLEVDIRGRMVEALVVKRPFYENPAVKA